MKWIHLLYELVESCPATFLLRGSSSVNVLVSNNKKKPDFIVAAYSFLF